MSIALVLDVEYNAFQPFGRERALVILGAGLLIAVLSLARPEVGVALLAYQPVIQHTTVGPVTIGYALALSVTVGLVIGIRRDGISFWQPLPTLAWLSLGGLAAFYIYTGVSAAWSPMPALALARGAKGLAVIGIGWLAFRYMSRSPDRLRTFLLALLIIGFVLTAIGVLTAACTDWDRSLPRITGEKQGLYRQAVGLFLILSLSFFLYTKASAGSGRWIWAALFAAIAFGVWAVLQSGSRGALLGISAVAGGLIAGSFIRGTSRWRAVAATLAVGVGLLAFAAANPGDNKVKKIYHNTIRAVESVTPDDVVAEAERQSPLAEADGDRSFQVVRDEPDGDTEDGGRTGPSEVRFVWAAPGEGVDTDLSLAGRLGCYRAALDIFEKHVYIGSGVGGYWTLTGGCYPHNATLEVAAEFGVLGLVLLALWIAPLGVILYQKARAGDHLESSHLFTVVALVFIFAFVYAQFGSVLEDNRILFLLTPAVALVPSARRNAAASAVH